MRQGDSRMTQGVYERINRLDGYAYTGSSSNIERRQLAHLSMLNREKHHCTALQAAWDKDGKDAFKFCIVEIVENPAMLVVVEQGRINKRIAEGKSYNTAQNAESPMAGRTHTTKSKQKMSDSHKGKKLTEKHRQNLSNARIGNQYALGSTRTEEWKQAASERMMGKQHALGSKRTDEQIARMMDHKHTEEWKQAHSERMMGNQYALGCTHSEEANRAKSERQMGKQYGLGYKHTDEEKWAISERMMGKQNALGSKRTDEQNRANSERMMGHPVSDTTRQKLADASAKPHPAFIHRDTGEIIPAGRNLKRMCQERGLGNNGMNRVKRGEQSHHKGWVLLVEKREE